MKKINGTLARSILLVIVISLSFRVTGQTAMPEELTKNSLKEQLKYLEERTRIYENYRAIREDMFQQIKLNITDSVTLSGNKIAALTSKVSVLNHKIDSLSATLAETKTLLEEMTRTKNSIKVVGIQVEKTIYNSVMWIIIAGLLILLGLGFLVFRRTISSSSNLKKELKELNDEFLAYKKTTREAREKMSMDHFNEIRKLKGG
jgi:prefoldin subunit 5